MYLNYNGFFSKAVLSTLRKLEEERYDLPNKEDNEWHLKSRYVWISGGDKNTKIFYYIEHGIIYEKMWQKGSLKSKGCECYIDDNTPHQHKNNPHKHKKLLYYVNIKLSFAFVL